MPLVSVIVPAYKVTPYIAETLNSILAQTFQDFEIVVVNDGCPDSEALERALDPYRSRVIYVRQENQGPASARNTAIRSGTATKYIALLDGDDKWDRDYLKVQTGIMEQDSTIDVLYCDAIVFGDGPGRGQRFMQMCPSHGEVTFQTLVDQTCTVMVSVLARRDAVMKAGLFDPDLTLRGSEDFDLWARILKRGGRITYHRRPLVYYRRRPTSLSANRLSLCNSFIRVLQKLLYRSDISEPERKSAQHRIEHLRAQMYWEEGRVSISRGDAEEAIEKLSHANSTLRSSRLGLLVLALRIWPRLAIQAYRLRRWILLLRER
jgi:glycosyltransferase involved in cell wall biosynthesis